MKIQGKGALVSGGASGLGAATVRMLAGAGARVVIADVNDQLGQKLAQELGPSVIFVKTDITQEEQVQKLVEQAVKHTGGLHILVNTAGIGVGEKVLGKNGPHDLKKFTRVIQVNLIGTFDVLRQASQPMASNAPDEGGNRGVIINTASIAAFDGQIGQVAYSASKGGLVGLTLPAARDLASRGIRVSTIAPGTFDTPMLAALPQERRDALGAAIPFPSRLGAPDEYASLALEIVRNPMINGETIRLDGALRMPPR